MERPDSLTPNSQGVPQVFQWADRMGLGRLDVCYKTTARTGRGRRLPVRRRRRHGGLDRAERAHREARRTAATATGSRPTSTSRPAAGWQAEYVYDDIAFVWTFSSKAAPTTPIYVQSLARRGAATATAGKAGATVALPRGGYTAIPGAVQQYSDTADYREQPDGRWRLHTDAQRASLRTALTTADAVRKGWDGATTATAGVASYQANNGATIAGWRPARPGDRRAGPQAPQPRRSASTRAPWPPRAPSTPTWSACSPPCTGDCSVAARRRGARRPVCSTTRWSASTERTRC